MVNTSYEKIFYSLVSLNSKDPYSDLILFGYIINMDGVAEKIFININL